MQLSEINDTNIDDDLPRIRWLERQTNRQRLRERHIWHWMNRGRGRDNQRVREEWLPRLRPRHRRGQRGNDGVAPLALLAGVGVEPEVRARAPHDLVRQDRQ